MYLETDSTKFKGTSF